MTAPDARRTVDAVWKLESARLIGALTRLVRDVGLAENLAQDALVAALEEWPGRGVPDNPGAWLMTVAKRRAVDHLRRRERSDRGHREVAHALARRGDEDTTPAHDASEDGVLPLLFLACDPALRVDDRAALTLRIVAGLSSEEIARAYLVPTAVVTRRVARAKRALADAGVDLDAVRADAYADRLASVLEVVYLVFNEGYAATAGDDLLQPALCHEALRLGRLLAELAPEEPEVHGLVALMELQSSRLRARTGPTGAPVPLHEQDRGRWDRLLIRRGVEALLRARRLGQPPGRYVLQAAIAASHAQAGTAEEVDWAQIVGLYDALAAVAPTPVVRLNRAVAVGMAAGPAAGLAATETLAADTALRDHHHLPSVRGDLLVKLGRHAEARAEFQRAAALTRNVAEQAFLARRAADIAAAPLVGRTLGELVREFLERTDLAPSTRRSYAQTLERLRRDLGPDTPLSALAATDVARVFDRAWGAAGARTWNRHRAAARSFVAWATGQRGVWSGEELTAGVARRAEPRVAVAPVVPGLLDALCDRPDVALRERTLWCLIAESGAPVASVLALDVQDLHLEDRRAWLPGERASVTWGSRTAALLPTLVDGRSRGPLFLTVRRPGPASRARPEDRCHHTGRTRLSYERAEHLFKRATRDLDPAGEGYTLRRLTTLGAGRP